MILDDLRNYLQMASGLTEATTTKAREVVGGLVAQGLQLSAKAVPAPEMMGQVQELADELVATSRNNREMLLGMIRSEVDRAVGRMGFVREDELEALRRHVQRLEGQVTGLEVSLKATSARPTTPTPAVAPAGEPSTPGAGEPSTPPAGEPPTPAEGEATSDRESASEAPPVKKKKILVDPEASA